MNVQEVQARRVKRASKSKIAGAVLDKSISSSRSTGAIASRGIPHTCATGTCLQVARWGDDEEPEAKQLACVACILGLRRREQPVSSAEVEGARSGDRRPAKSLFIRESACTRSSLTLKSTGCILGISILMSTATCSRSRQQRVVGTVDTSVEEPSVEECEHTLHTSTEVARGPDRMMRTSRADVARQSELRGRIDLSCTDRETLQRV